MLADFSTEYSQRSNDELLHLATQRHSLTTEAATALDGELRRRNLTESDRVEHQKPVKRQERRESRRRHRKIFGKDQFSWLELLSSVGAMARCEQRFPSAGRALSSGSACPSSLHLLALVRVLALRTAKMTAIVGSAVFPQ